MTRSRIMAMVAFAYTAMIASVPLADAHGYMINPPARNSAWKLPGNPHNVPAEWDLMGLNCLGAGVAEDLSKCKPCSGTKPGYLAPDGKYATGAITATYSSGDIIDVDMVITAWHGGAIRMRLCPEYDGTSPVTQECFNRYPLRTAGGQESFSLGSSPRREYSSQWRLPEGVTCERCVLQWWWDAGITAPEKFINCADISIGGSGGDGGGVTPVVPSRSPSPSPRPAASASPSPAGSGSGSGSGGACSGCWSGTSGPCKASNTVCYGYYAGTTMCPAGTTPCGSGPAPAPSPSATPSSVAPAPSSSPPQPDASSAPAPSMPPHHHHGDGDSWRRVMYFTAWSIYGRKFFLNQVDGSKVTHINYAFIDIQNGRCTLMDPYADTEATSAWPGLSWSDNLRGNLAALQRFKAQYPHVRTMMSVGGWSKSKYFSDVALTPQSRSLFVSSCMGMMRQYGFDGVDLDWEYPVEGGLDTNIRRPSDGVNYASLLEDFRAAMAPGDLLTIAAPADERKINHMPLDRLAAVLDFINVMTYDYHGGWDLTATGFNAPMYAQSSSPFSSVVKSTFNVAHTIGVFLNAGVAPEKVVMGVAFYGRGYAGVSTGPDGDGRYQPAQRLPQGSWEAGVFDYKDLVTNYIGKNGYQVYRDDDAKMPYLYSPSAGVWISYDDEESMRYRCEYVRRLGLGGMMAWELSNDAGMLLSVVHDGLDPIPATGGGGGHVHPSSAPLPSSSSAPAPSSSAQPSMVPSSAPSSVSVASATATATAAPSDMPDPTDPPGDQICQCRALASALAPTGCSADAFNKLNTCTCGPGDQFINAPSPYGVRRLRGASGSAPESIMYRVAASGGTGQRVLEPMSAVSATEAASTTGSGRSLAMMSGSMRCDCAPIRFVYAPVGAEACTCVAM